MSYYRDKVEQLTAEIYSNMYLTNKIIHAKQIIDNEYANRLTIDVISKKACISKFHLIRSFKKIYGITPYQHLTIVRLARAKILLQTNMPAVDSCAAVGFDSITSFTTLFRKKVGCPPVLFQRNQVKKQFLISPDPIN